MREREGDVRGWPASQTWRTYTMKAREEALRQNIGEEKKVKSTYRSWWDKPKGESQAFITNGKSLAHDLGLAL